MPDIRSEARKHPDYKAMARRLKEHDIDCHWCGRDRASEPDHEPALALFACFADWLTVGVLVPACRFCNRSRGSKVAQRRRSKPKPLKRSALVYPPASR